MTSLQRLKIGLISKNPAGIPLDPVIRIKKQLIEEAANHFRDQFPERRKLEDRYCLLVKRFGLKTRNQSDVNTFQLS